MIAPATNASAGAIDQVVLNFDAGNLAILNAILALVMFGVALDLKPADFRRALTSGKPLWIGLGSQFLLLPAFSFLMVTTFEPRPSMALGIMLVAACPGGSMSNFITHMARGNTPLSVSMSAISTLAATVMTPLNLSFWGGLYPPTAELMKRVQLDPWLLAGTVALLLVVPISLGMTFASWKPDWAEKLRQPMRRFSLLVFGLFLIGALAANWDYFLNWAGIVAAWVIVQNALALILGYSAAKVAGLPVADRRAVSIEVGLQNTALGLVLAFDFFPGLGGTALITGWWGVWHIMVGLALGLHWSRAPIKQ